MKTAHHDGGDAALVAAPAGSALMGAGRATWTCTCPAASGSNLVTARSSMLLGLPNSPETQLCVACM